MTPPPKPLVMSPSERGHVVFGVDPIGLDVSLVVTLACDTFLCARYL